MPINKKTWIRRAVSVTPWIALIAIGLFCLRRLPSLAPELTIRHAPLPMALEALTEDRNYQMEWEARIAEARPADRLTLRNLLNHDRDQFRWIAATRLGELKDTESVASLVRLLEVDDSFQVKYESARALAAIGDRRCIPPLIAALNDPDVVVRNVAVEALRLLNATEAIPAIRAFAERKDYPSAQYVATEALKSLHERPAVPETPPFKP